MANPFVGHLPFPSIEEGLAPQATIASSASVVETPPDTFSVIKVLFTPDPEAGYYWTNVRLDDNDRVKDNEFVLCSIKNPNETETLHLRAIFRAADDETHEAQSPITVSAEEAFKSFFNEVAAHLHSNPAIALIFAHRF